MNNEGLESLKNTCLVVGLIALFSYIALCFMGNMNVVLIARIIFISIALIAYVITFWAEIKTKSKSDIGVSVFLICICIFDIIITIANIIITNSN